MPFLTWSLYLHWNFNYPFLTFMIFNSNLLKASYKPLLFWTRRDRHKLELTVEKISHASRLNFLNCLKMTKILLYFGMWVRFGFAYDVCFGGLRHVPRFSEAFQKLMIGHLRAYLDNLFTPVCANDIKLAVHDVSVKTFWIMEASGRGREDLWSLSLVRGRRDFIEFISLNCMCTWATCCTLVKRK